MRLHTPKLLERYDEMVLLKKLKVITKDEFKSEVKKLYDQQKKIDARNEKAQLVREKQRERERAIEYARLDAIAEAKKKKPKNVVVKNKISKDLVVDSTYTLDIHLEDFIQQMWMKVKDLGEVYIYTNPIGNDAYDYHIRFDDVHKIKDYESFKFIFIHYSDGVFRCLIPDQNVKIWRSTPLVIKKMKQKFRDGITHCVFTPIKQKILENINTTKSKDAIKKWKSRYNNINDLEKKYELGVPEDKMIDVAITSGLKIIINDIIGSELFVYNDKSKKGSLIFTNTRANHIDTGFLTLADKGIELSKSDMLKKWKEIGDDFYMIQGDLIEEDISRKKYTPRKLINVDGRLVACAGERYVINREKKYIPRKLMTLDGAWSVINPEKKYIDEMNEIAQIDKCRFNATKYPDVNEFIKSGRIINSWNLNLGTGATGHIDMKKAYTQFKQCSFYKGFLGVIHQWRSGKFDLDFIKNHIGIYRFKIIEFDNQLLCKLGFVIGGKYTLPSVEIEYFISLGMIVEIDAGVFGASIDFEFTEDMLLKGEDGVPRYSKWSGTLGAENHFRNYTFKCDAEWAGHLKSELNAENVFYWEKLGVCSVKMPIENVYTTHHILAFITSYVRIQMIQTMMKFDINNLVRVVMDGLYYKGDLPEVDKIFIAKEIKDCDYSEYWYSPSTVEVVWDSDVFSKNTLLTGAGGNGKTYKVLNDKGLNRVLFVAPMNLLGKGVASQYKIRSTTIHKLLGKDCVPWIKEQAYPPVILMDETTQIQADWIDEVFIMYPKSLILLAGDIDTKQWFQCRNGRPGDFSKIWKPVNVDIISMDIDRRSLDDELRQLKADIRNKMKEVFVDGDNYNECIKMTMWANKLNTISFDDAVKQFSIGDVWIAGTHAINVKLLENGVVSGWYKKGGNISYEEKENFEKRGSFTTHSFQGQTIEDKKVFISINSCFEYSMLFTSVSRVRRFSQLVFVR